VSAVNGTSVSPDSVVVAVPEETKMAAADLSNLVQRLEAVTVRLEATAARGGAGGAGDAG
jgi:GTPase involved in cell partitioning and DNA repair